MKKLVVSMVLAGLSFVSLSGFASVLSAYPPVPGPGISCKSTYDPSKDLTSFCGCYEESAVTQCKILAAHGFVPAARMCTGPFTTLVTLTCAQEKTRGVASFCKDNVNKLHASGDSTTTEQDCIDDVGYICDQGAAARCSPWPTA